MKISTRRYWLAVAVVILSAAGMARVSALEGSQEQSASINKVQTWLAEMGVDQAVQANFVAHDVNVEALLVLSRQQMEELGLTQLGRQARLTAKAKQEQEVKKRHSVASIRTNTYGDSTDKGGIQFCTKDGGGAEVAVKAVLSADGCFGIGVEGEPEAKLHVAGDAIFAAGHCDRIHAQYINVTADVLVQERSVMDALGELRVLQEADRAGEMRLKEEVSAVNSSLLKQLEDEISTKDRQIASLSATLDEHIANLTTSLTTSLKELQDQIIKKDDQIANLTIEIHKDITTRDEEIKSHITTLSVPVGTILSFLGESAPDGYILCNGQTLDAVSNDEYSHLFTVIGTQFGGTSKLDFKVPDLNGYFLRGASSSVPVGTFQDDTTAVNGLSTSSSEDGNHYHTSGQPLAGTYDSSAYGSDSLSHAKVCPSSIQSYNPVKQYFTSTEGAHSHTISLSGDVETRPKNLSVNYIIRYQDTS